MDALAWQEQEIDKENHARAGMSRVAGLTWKQRRQQLIDQAAEEKWRTRIKRPVVISFSRCNPPATEHAALVRVMVQEANRVGAIHIILFPSATQDMDENPLPFVQKVKFLRQLFPGIKVSGNPNIRTPFEAIAGCALKGFDSVTLVAGQDRATEFQKFAKYIKSKGLPDGKRIILKHFEVVSVPENDGVSDVTLRLAARNGDWRTFRDGVPTKSHRLARDIYDTLRRNVGLMERKPILFLYGTSTRARKTLHEGFASVRKAHGKVPCYTIKEDASFSAIRNVIRQAERKGYAPTIYVLDAALPAQISESWMKRQTTCGLLLRQFPKNCVTLGAYGVLEAVTHAETMLEAEQGPKQPTEVDRLRTSQQREKLALQQRQGNAILQAKERELQKKSREKAQQLAAPKKPAGQGR